MLLILSILTSVLIWLISGHALETIYYKAGFRHVPWLLFWLPGINLILLLYLVLAVWPMDNQTGEKN
ncbi:MAG: hypothetical protein OXE99_12165 [Cellvibrionales bacterium]|nr:hypothetical protein [Cellvibrionales bacterium]